MWLVRLFLGLFLDQKGEGEAEGQAAAPAKEQVAAPEGEEQGQEGEGEGEGQGEGTPASPAYGDFGDIPKTEEESKALLSKMFESISNTKKEYETLKGKTTATEQNAAALNKALKTFGIKAVKGDDGNVSFKVEEEKKPAKTYKFTDDHKKQFGGYFKEGGDKFLELLEYAMEDRFNDFFDGRIKTSREQSARLRVQQQEIEESVGTMLAIYPQLEGKWKDDKPTNPDFDSAFHAKAEEIWESKYDKNPRKQLQAAVEAAKELKISSLAIGKAKKEGFEKGKENKKILGPVGKGGKSSKQGPMSKEAYLKLSQPERDKYDKEQMGI